MRGCFVLVLALVFTASCSYNKRVDAADTTPASTTPFVPPTPPVPDTTPPANVSAVALHAANTTLQLSWNAPTDGDYKGTRIYWATSAANLNHAGTRTLLCDDCMPGVIHSALTNGTTYYYLLISYDYTGNTAAGVTTNGAPVNNSFSCPDTSAADCLQIASFNLEYFVTGFSGTNTVPQQDAKKTGAANIILNAGFDIVALQEVKDSAVFTAWVASHLGAGWSYSLSSSGCDAKTAFIYKTTLVSLVSVSELSVAPFNTGDWDGCLRRPLAGIFKSTATSRMFRLINVHLKSGAGSASDTAACPTRQQQAGNLNSYLNTTSTMPTLLLGDMNDEVKAGVGICTYQGIDTLNSLETNSGITFLTKAPTMENGLYTNIPFTSTIDHLVVNSAFSPWVVPARLTYTADIVMHGSQNISDHQPVFLWMKLR